MSRLARVLAISIATILIAAACQAPRATSESTPASSAGASASKAPDFTGKTLNIVTGGTGGGDIVYGAGRAGVPSQKKKVAAGAPPPPAAGDNKKPNPRGKAGPALTPAGPP